MVNIIPVRHRLLQLENQSQTIHSPHQMLKFQPKLPANSKFCNIIHCDSKVKLKVFVRDYFIDYLQIDEECMVFVFVFAYVHWSHNNIDTLILRNIVAKFDIHILLLFCIYFWIMIRCLAPLACILFHINFYWHCE